MRWSRWRCTWAARCGRRASRLCSIVVALTRPLLRGSLQSPADYAGAMDLPNGKALSSDDLKKFLKHHHDGFAKKARARAPRSDGLPACSPAAG